ncbi:uncharacterized membrane protein YcaP (DUF421 family) [Deinococcus budaensis]|uniref:Uncharacterized membrane protein YcaP (DUF421 family) n=1 Tax=Deinococcus budaensis TaxID=1665626 RepID=A0A7W8GGK4_9DEIO|nr:DUF421 domain-containing protein [Deinococcus budaensis]MBB5234766.1 uncharacterized membrane protein YcaP (DUF421 family) [Deinococcus budaensis]
MSLPGEAGFQAFDWPRLLLGEGASGLLLLELVFRTGVIFLWLLFLLRVTGKRGLAQLSPLEFAIVIALGSAAGDPMLYTEVPLLQAMLVLAAVVGLQRGVSRLMNRSRKLETFVDGVPMELMRDGVILDGALRRSQLSQEDLFERLRPEGVEQLGQVRRVYLEQGGHLSVFLLPESQVRPGLPIVPPWDLQPPPPVPAGFRGPVACRHCGQVETGAGPVCTCGHRHWTVATARPWKLVEESSRAAGQDIPSVS